MATTNQQVCPRINRQVQLTIDNVGGLTGIVTDVACHEYTHSDLGCSAFHELQRYGGQGYHRFYGYPRALLAYLFNSALGRHVCIYREDELARRREAERAKNQAK